MPAIEWFFSLSHLEGCRHALLLGAWDSKSIRMFFQKENRDDRVPAKSGSSDAKRMNPRHAPFILTT